MSSSPSERLAALPKDEQVAFLAGLSDEEAAGLLKDWRGFLARPEQIAPEGDWDIWLALAGRGFGKTELGARWVHEKAEQGVKEIALVAETGKDLRQVIGRRIKAINPAVTIKMTPFEVHWPNGCVAYGYNGTEPDQLRGPEFGAAWVDELAKFRYARETWDMLQFTMRDVSGHPQIVVTTTPRPIEIIKSILSGKEGKVHVTRGNTDDNAQNLSAAWLQRIKRRYAGTRLGRQELSAEVLGDLPGALWSQDSIDSYRVRQAPTLARSVVAIDPAVTNTDESDAHGIVAAGVTGDADQAGYVLADRSINGSPTDWAKAALALYHEIQADAIIAEVNNGGDMVAHVLRSIAPNVNVIEVRASKGKHVRAEPIAALYAQGRVRHVGQFPELESQMTQFTNAGYQGSDSPDRADALVWALTELFPDMVDVVPDASTLNLMPMAGSWMA